MILYHKTFDKVQSLAHLVTYHKAKIPFVRISERVAGTSKYDHINFFRSNPFSFIRHFSIAPDSDSSGNGKH